MKANELRIGNWIHGRIGYNIQVDSGVLLRLEAETLGYDPIPLTEEWLLKFGFEYTDGEYAHECIWSLNGFEIWQHDEGFCHSYIKGGDVNYVHTTQNLYFALTGEELVRR